MKTPEKIYIFDTTLRDGQQSPGAGMSFEDNIHYANLANALGIDILEAGFPAASEYDFEIVRAISNDMAKQNSKMIVAALCQLREEQIIRTMDALQPSLAHGTARLHTYVPVDPNLMDASLGKFSTNYVKIIDDVYQFIKLATDSGYQVEFSPEGYSRMQNNFSFVTDVIRAAVSAGATIINCPDTIGGAARWQEDYFVNNMKKHKSIIEKEFSNAQIIWSVHCHNDLGLALENSLEAVVNGPARQIEGCINGIGERAGNVALEQCIMAIDQFGLDMHSEKEFFTEINLESLNEISNFVAENMLSRQSHWPITGHNAARHSSGGHTNAILKNPMAYQPFDPKRIGTNISFVFGPLSGSNHAKSIIECHGFNCSNDEKAMIAQAIKDKFSTRRKGITDEEVIQAYKAYYAPIKLERIDYSKNEVGRAVVKIIGQFFSKSELEVHGVGENSALAALDSAVKEFFPNIEITDYCSNSCAGGTVNVKCSATVIVTVAGQENYIGKAIDADINLAAIKAYIDAVNQAYINTHYRKQEADYA